MNYITEYEICALVFLAVVTMRFFTKRHFPSMQNRLFGILLWSAMADLTLDVVTAVTISFATKLPSWVNTMLNTAFYLMQTVIPVLVLYYTMALAGTLRRQGPKKLTIQLLPAAFAISLLAVNIFTGIIFYIDPSAGYTHGAWFPVLYVVCGFYMALTMVVVFRQRLGIQRKQFSTILWFLLLSTAAIVVQAFYPALLITGVTIALAFTMMYWTLQNPQDMIDVMTGVYNYDAMLQFLGKHIQDGRRFSIVAVDIRDVYRINRMFGLGSGNQALIGVGHYLAQGAQSAWVFRMMGNRFVAIINDKNEYKQIQRQIGQRFSQPWDIGITEIMLNATICCLSEPDCFNRSLDEVVSLLETAFDSADTGGGQIKMLSSDEGLLDTLKRTMAVEAALQEALETGAGLQMYFQPVYSVKKKRFSGAEALLRFNHPVLGSVSPAEFVPIAEKNGLILKLDESVVKMVCEFIKKYDPRGTLGVNRIGINLSAAEFMNRQLPERMTAVLDSYHIDPCLLIFEITETAATVSYEMLSACMEDLRGKGIRFALDDFGTGYANISQVVRLPFAMVKMDRSLLNGSRTVMEDSLYMFARLGLQTVVEGVETAEQAAMLSAINMDYVQGYFYAMPMPVAEFVAFMEKQKEQYVNSNKEDF